MYRWSNHISHSDFYLTNGIFPIKMQCLYCPTTSEAAFSQAGNLRNWVPDGLSELFIVMVMCAGPLMGGWKHCGHMLCCIGTGSLLPSLCIENIPWLPSGLLFASVARLPSPNVCTALRAETAIIEPWDIEEFTYMCAACISVQPVSTEVLFDCLNVAHLLKQRCTIWSCDWL